MMYEIIALAWSVVSLIACVIGVVTPYWTYASKAGASAARGLWYNCDTGDSTAYCFSKLSSGLYYIHIQIIFIFQMQRPSIVRKSFARRFYFVSDIYIASVVINIIKLQIT